MALVTAWATVLALAVGFGLYPAPRARRLSPMEAMRQRDASRLPS